MIYFGATVAAAVIHENSFQRLAETVAIFFDFAVENKEALVFISEERNHEGNVGFKTEATLSISVWKLSWDEFR